ncbi:MAG: NF038122 family metalloprotease [Cyanobium sp.]
MPLPASTPSAPATDATAPNSWLRQWRRRTSALVLALVGWGASQPAALALRFDFVCGTDPSCASLNSNAYAGFQAAANRWSSIFFDPITVKLSIGFESMAPNILGGTYHTENFLTYSDFRTALGLDRQSSNDNQAFASLPSGSTFPLLINRTANNPAGVGSATPYVDNDGDVNNFTINISTANLKAIGVSPDYGTDASALDGEISFNSLFNWDFNPDNGISSGSYDFVAVATHEIGHVLGFLSGVDILDYNSPDGTTYYNDDQFYYVNPLDLYRYSAQSLASGVIDWTADSRAKYFSIDAGISSLGGFSTGATHGDGRQASHWKDNLGLGLLDPTLASGEIGQISALDRLAFDVIGYDTLSRVPAPLPLLGGSAALLWSRRLRERRAGGQRPS